MLIIPKSATATNPFNKTNVTTLINMIYGSSGDMNTQISELQSQLVELEEVNVLGAITAKDLRAQTYNKTADQSIVVRLGGLDWIVTYVSTDTSGNLVATLWLSNNHQDAWSGITQQNIGKYCAIVQGGLYSDWSADWNNSIDGTYPSNMYGTSYIRVETLNNPTNRKYATSKSALTDGTSQSTAHPFALYTVASKGLTNYITTPDQMKWMVNRQNPSAWGERYLCSNDSLTSDGAYNYSDSWRDSSFNYESKTGYANWGKDYLWLPSMAETGYNNTAVRNDGLWETNTAERTTYDGSTTSLTASSAIGSSNGNSTNASCYSWSRSADYISAYKSYALAPSGLYNGLDYVDSSKAVRPALLLDLSAVAAHVDVAGSLDSVIDSDYEYTITNPYQNDSFIEDECSYDISGGSYGWYITGDGNMQATNVGIDSSYSGFKLSVTVTETAVLAITFSVSAEIEYDFLTVYNHSTDEWYVEPYNFGEYFDFVTVKYLLYEGTNDIGFYYVKDSGDADGDDCAYISSIEIKTAAVLMTITLDNQGATTAGTTSVSAAEGVALPSITPPTKTGYVFGGYYTAANGGGTEIYTAGGGPAISTSTFTADTTLYAKWTARSYTVTLNNQSATTAGTASVKATYKSSMPSITTPTKTGYAFGGYYTATNGGGTKIYNADGTPAISASTFTADTTLYAYWTDWYKITMTGSTTAYETYYSNDEEYKFISLTITPTAGHIISQISFDNTNWYSVEYIRYDIGNTTMAVNVAYYANENSNSLVLEFKGIMTSDVISVYAKTTAGSYSGLKIAGGGNVDGVAVQSTYGGVAMVVGANFAEMTDDDYIICSTMAIDNYEFMYWMDSAGNKLSFDESVKFKKKDVYGSIITAVFAPVGTDPNTYVVVDNSE